MHLQRHSAPAPGPLSNPTLDTWLSQNRAFKSGIGSSCLALSDHGHPPWCSPCSGESYPGPLVRLPVDGEVDEIGWSSRGVALDCVGAGGFEGCGSTGWLKPSLPGEYAEAAVGSTDLEVFEGEHSAWAAVSLGGGADAVPWAAWFEGVALACLEEGCGRCNLSAPWLHPLAHFAVFAGPPCGAGEEVAGHGGPRGKRNGVRIVQAGRDWEYAARFLPADMSSGAWRFVRDW
jgi:hypothetical protein